MTLVTAKPGSRTKPVFYNGLDRFFDDFFRLDQSSVSGNSALKHFPAVNILETEKDFQLEFVVPGWEKSDFQIQVEKNTLVVAATNQKEEGSETQKENGTTYRRREFARNSFKRSFQIPETVQTDAIDARYQNGILTLTLPKRKEAQPEPVRTIEIG